MPKTKRIKTIDAGRLHEAVIYTPPRNGDARQQRDARKKASTKAQAAANAKSQKKRLEYLIAANFTPADRFVTFNYREEDLPKNRRAARAQLRATIKNIRSIRNRTGQGFKYIYTTEDVNGSGRIHHHLVVTAAPGDIEALRSLWPYGEVDVETLGKYGDDQAGQTAGYMLKEWKPNGEQGFTCSKKMTPPTIKTEWIEDNYTITAPRGAIVLEEGKETTEFSEYYHLKYIRPIPDTDTEAQK